LQTVISLGIDESKSGSLLVVSAVVGKAACTQKLDAEWKRDLAEKGVDYFHAQEHWNLRSKPYHGLGMPEREELLTRLVAHVHRRSLFCASAMVDETDYLGTTSQRFRSQYGSPYGWGFQMLMTMILIELKRQRRENQPVNILIEEGHRNSHQVLGFIEHKKKLPSKKGLPIAHHETGQKTDNPILQVADLVAFGVCEAHTKGESVFASRMATRAFRRRFLVLPWNSSSTNAAKADIIRQANLLKAGVPSAKRRTEMVMW
jgi:hypothetical protein